MSRVSTIFFSIKCMQSGIIHFFVKMLFSWKHFAHGTAEWLRLKGPLEVIVQTSAQAEHVELVAQDHVQKGFEYQCTHMHL